MKNETPELQHRNLRQVEWLAKLMDARFRIPGTGIRFGLDALIGLIPGAGDIIGLGISFYMVVLMARSGASSFLLGRMVVNVLLDTFIGSIPVLGDVFDVAYKANMRNLRLMQNFLGKSAVPERKSHPDKWWLYILVGLSILAVLWIVIQGTAMLYHEAFRK